MSLPKPAPKELESEKGTKSKVTNPKTQNILCIYNDRFVSKIKEQRYVELQNMAISSLRQSRLERRNRLLARQQKRDQKLAAATTDSKKSPYDYSNQTTTRSRRQDDFQKSEASASTRSKSVGNNASSDPAEDDKDLSQYDTSSPLCRMLMSPDSSSEDLQQEHGTNKPQASSHQV